MARRLTSVNSSSPYQYAVFTTVGNGSWTVPSNIFGKIEVWVVAGGGNGGNGLRVTTNPTETIAGSGGGAGGVTYYGTYTASAGQSIGYTIGAGGVQSISNDNNGGDSVWDTAALNLKLTAKGGGSANFNMSGGSGAGGYYYGGTGGTGANTPGSALTTGSGTFYGSPGGPISGTASGTASGGGGASGIAPGTNVKTGSDGKVLLWADGTNDKLIEYGSPLGTYAAGGGAGGSSTSGTGGSGGGGNGATGTGTGANATGYGSGGGGGGLPSSTGTTNGGNGSQGIIIIKYTIV